MRQTFKLDFVANRKHLRQIVKKNEQLKEDEKHREKVERIKEKWRKKRKEEEAKAKERLRRWRLRDQNRPVSIPCIRPISKVICFVKEHNKESTFARYVELVESI